MATFMAQQQTGVAATETARPAKRKLFTEQSLLTTGTEQKKKMTGLGGLQRKCHPGRVNASEVVGRGEKEREKR